MILLFVWIFFFAGVSPLKISSTKMNLKKKKMLLVLFTKPETM